MHERTQNRAGGGGDRFPRHSSVHAHARIIFHLVLALGVISACGERTVPPLGALAIMGETMFTSISCQEDLWLHFAVMEN